jgi:hypothetical protein
MNFDVVVSIGFEMDLAILKLLRQMKTKIVSYNCGNNYIIDSECMLFSQHPAKNNQINYIRPKAYVPYDIIWSIPQMTNTNQHYWQTLMRTKCIEVPFIWSDKSINLIQLAENISGRESDSSINKFNIDAFTIYVNNFDLCADKKVTIEGRFNTLSFMNTYGDIAVSHQWENNLNYLYFDLAWMGWPIVHNASLCKDVGYYYPEFNYEEGGKKIIEAIKTHEDNKDEYLERNRRAIDKYLPTNRELQQKYIKLISDLFEPEPPIEIDSLSLNFPISEKVQNKVIGFIPKSKEEDGVKYILI